MRRPNDRVGFFCLVIEMLVFLLIRVRSASQPGGMRNSNNLRCCSRRFFNKAKRSDWDCWSAYRSRFNDYKKEIKRPKRTTWISFCESIEGVAEVARFRRMLSRDPKIRGFVQKNNVTWTASRKESLGAPLIFSIVWIQISI